jgi:gluconolactonase
LHQGIATLFCSAVVIASCATSIAAPSGFSIGPALLVIDGAAHYPEGPLWHDGALLYVEYSTGDIKRWQGQHSSVFWHGEGCGPSGLIARGSKLLVACYDGNYLQELDAAGHALRQLRTDSAGKPFAGPNDFAADAHGGIYFSASGAYDVKAPATGALLYLHADGSTLTRVAEGIHYANGLALTKDRSHLLVAEMLAGQVLSFKVESDGSLAQRTVWARLQDLAPATAGADAYNGPDGLKLGPDGNYYIAQNGSGRVLVVDERRKLVRTIEVPTPYVTNIAFDPRAPGALFITGAFEQWQAPFPGAVYRWRP